MSTFATQFTFVLYRLSVTLPETRGKLNVEVTDATIPIIEKLNATVSTSCHEVSTLLSFRVMGTCRKLPPEFALITQSRKQGVICNPYSDSCRARIVGYFDGFRNLLLLALSRYKSSNHVFREKSGRELYGKRWA